MKSKDLIKNLKRFLVWKESLLKRPIFTTLLISTSRKLNFLEINSSFLSSPASDSDQSQVKKYNSLKFHYMPPSFICVLKIRLHESQIEPVKILEGLEKVNHESLYPTLAEHLLATDINHLSFRLSSID